MVDAALPGALYAIEASDYATDTELAHPFIAEAGQSAARGR